MKDKTISFFVFDSRLEKISKLGDRHEKLNKAINWKQFTGFLETKLPRLKDKPQGGRPAYTHECMFKILVLQTLYGLSDDEMEFMLNDRISFQKFIGRLNEENMPDAKTIWLYRESLKEQKLTRILFRRFRKELQKNYLHYKRGSIVDATFIEVPRQRNSREENTDIKNGSIPSEWETEENKNKLRQKDTDARWTKKNNETFYGYKDHVKVDAKTKLITNYKVTSAEVHDSRKLIDLLEKEDENKPLYADSAYKSEAIDAELAKKKIINKIHEKGTRNNSLTKKQINTNKQKSKTRVRVEHVFAFFVQGLRGTYIRTIGTARAEVKIGLMNLVYNMCRVLQISNQGQVRSVYV
jgi:IS5 family transposase